MHLLLAAAHLATGALRHFAQIGEQPEQPGRRPLRCRAAIGPVTRGLLPYRQVFQHAQVAEDAPVFRHIAQAQASGYMRFGGGDVMAHELHPARALAQQAHQGFQRGGLAGTVAPQQGHHFAALHLHIHAKQNLCRAVPGAQVLGLQQGVGLRVHQSSCTAIAGGFSKVLPLPK